LTTLVTVGNRFMPSIVFQSCDTDQPFGNHERTVAHAVDLREYSQRLDANPDVMSALRSCYPRGMASIWGLPDLKSSVAKFEVMAPGDLILFHRGGLVFWCATITTKWESPSLASLLWPPDRWSNRSFPYVFGLTENASTSCSISDVARTINRPRFSPGKGTQILKGLGIGDLTIIRSRLLSFASPPPAQASKSRGTSAFFSYSHADAEIARQLAAGIAERGITVWRDEGELRLGDSLIEVISGAIASVDFIIALVSEASVQSKWCREELAQAASKGVESGFPTVLPLRLGDVAMPPTIAHRLWLQVDTENLDRAIDLVVKDLTLRG
jgi:hypothetical protein